MRLASLLTSSLLALALIGACRRDPAPATPEPSTPPTTTSAPRPIETAAPSPTPTAAEAAYDVVMVAANDVLNVRAAAEPGAALVHALAHDARGVRATGEETTVGTTRWRRLETPSGLGWANGTFLTPSTSSAAFAADPRPAALLDALRAALVARGDLRPLVSPRGLYVHDFGRDLHFPHDTLGALAGSDAKRKWNGPACGEECREGSFHQVVGAPLAEVLGKAGVERASDRALKGGNASVLPPAKFANFHFMAVLDRGSAASDHLDWRSFGLYFESVDGEPKLVAIVPDVWSP